MTEKSQIAIPDESCGLRGGELLAYGIRKSVTYCKKESSPRLILHYPLSTIRLHPCWAPVFDRLSGSGPVTLADIIDLVQPADAEKVEDFLNHLVSKGFLEHNGYKELIDYPFVSIIIPVKNRPEAIAACLQSLGKLHYPREKKEIIVVDDASDDNTPDIVSMFPVHFISLKEPKRASFCRNFAARQAKGEFLAFIDSDCLADSLWLRELIPVFRDQGVGAVGGMVDASFEKKGLDRYEKVKSSLNMGSWLKSSREGNCFFYIPSCNLLVRRNVFLRLGGFREDLHLGEDVDFCWRLQDAGYHIEYRSVGRVYHHHRNRLMSFCLRRFDYGTSEPLLQQLHVKRKKKLTFPLAASFFWGFVVFFLTFVNIASLALGWLVMVIDSLFKWVEIHPSKIPISFFRMTMAIFRSYLAFFYHICAFISRYYLILSILIFPLLPLATAIILGMHFFAGIVEYFIKKPRLNPVSYLFYFSLEQLFYQLGVWWGCFKTFNFNPVNPKIVIKLKMDSEREQF